MCAEWHNLPVRALGRGPDAVLLWRGLPPGPVEHRADAGADPEPLPDGGGVHGVHLWRPRRRARWRPAGGRNHDGGRAGLQRRRHLQHADAGSQPGALLARRR